MITNRSVSRDALTLIYLGSGLTQAAALFGILISIIAWTAMNTGGPGFFVFGPIIATALLVWPMIKRASSVEIFKRGREVSGRWVAVDRQAVQVQRPRGGGDWVVKATWVYKDASGKEYRGHERMREPNAPDPDQAVRLLLLKTGNGHIVRPEAIHRRLQLTDRDVTTDRATWSLIVLPAAFALVNLIGMAA